MEAEPQPTPCTSSRPQAPVAPSSPSTAGSSSTSSVMVTASPPDPFEPAAPIGDAPASPVPASRLLKRVVLYVFSGPTGRADGLRSYCRSRGHACIEVDLLVGGDKHDMSVHAVAAHFINLTLAGEFAAVIIATPCVSYCIAHSEGQEPWRTAEHPSGRPDISDAARAWLAMHDRLAQVSADLAQAALDVGAQVIVENPAPRSDPSLASFWAAKAHMPSLWSSPPFVQLCARAGSHLRMVVQPQCAYGPGPHGQLFQKYTGFLCSIAAGSRLASLNHETCMHAVHSDVAAGYDADGKSIAARAAAYPGPLNDALSWALTGVGRKPSHRPKVAPIQWDRSIVAGRVADGPLGSRHVRAAVEWCRAAPPRWASFRNLIPASDAELRTAPFPDLLPQQRWSAPPQSSTAAAHGPAPDPTAALREHLGRNIRISDLWMPGEFEEVQAWLSKARFGRRMPRLVKPQRCLVPLARGTVWDCRDPENCVELAASTRHTVFPGARQMDRAAFRAAAAEVGSLDADIISQAGEGGIEDRSVCDLSTVLESHLPGLWERPEAAAEEIGRELSEKWALGPFYHPPFVPMRCLPRDVVVQQRSRPRPDGSIEDYEKDRITLHASSGEDSVNAGIPQEERAVAFTNARDLGRALAMVDVPAREAGVGAGGFGIDITSAYSFLLAQRRDWWKFCYVWWDEQGRLFISVLVRVGFGGASSPLRFQSVAVILVSLIRKRAAEFDALHPYPARVADWVANRVELQRRGLLPAGAAQCSPVQIGAYLDDIAGGCPNDPVPMPDQWRGMPTAGIDLAALTAAAAGGKPLQRDSRPACHAVGAIQAIRELGFEDASSKMEGGSVFINLGLRIDLEKGIINCPERKQRVMARDLQDWLDRVNAPLPFSRKMAERQVGRLVNLTQALPELLLHLDSGFRAANASKPCPHGSQRNRVKLVDVPMRQGSTMHRGLSRLLPHALDVLQRNEGVPLAPRALFPAPHEPRVLIATTDASGEDGCGGYVFLWARPTEPILVSARWPADIRAALAEAAKPASLRDPQAPMLSMPAAELFAAMAVPAAAFFDSSATITVGDCDPAADAINAAASSVPQMSALLAFGRSQERHWLAVSVPREWNVDADRLSHPELLADVVNDARAAGMEPVVRDIPAVWWQALREAIYLNKDVDAWMDI